MARTGRGDRVADVDGPLGKAWGSSAALERAQAAGSASTLIAPDRRGLVWTLTFGLVLVVAIAHGGGWGTAPTPIGRIGFLHAAVVLAALAGGVLPGLVVAAVAGVASNLWGSSPWLQDPLLAVVPPLVVALVVPALYRRLRTTGASLALSTALGSLAHPGTFYLLLLVYGYVTWEGVVRVGAGRLFYEAGLGFVIAFLAALMLVRIGQRSARGADSRRR